MWAKAEVDVEEEASRLLDHKLYDGAQELSRKTCEPIDGRL